MVVNSSHREHEMNTSGNANSIGFSIDQIWRYPVKSMRGELLEEANVTPGGILYDRGWAVRDEKANTIRGAKYMPTLLQCSAKYL